MRAIPTHAGTDPTLNGPRSPASSGDNGTVIGAAVGVSVAILLMIIVIVVIAIYMARRSTYKKHKVSAKDIPLTPVQTPDNVGDSLGNPTYTVAGGIYYALCEEVLGIFMTFTK